MSEHGEEFNLVAIYDYILGIERKLVLIERLQEQMFYTARRNMHESKSKDKQFMLIGENTIMKSIRGIEENLDWIKKEVQFAEAQPDGIGMQEQSTEKEKTQ